LQDCITVFNTKNARHAIILLLIATQEQLVNRRVFKAWFKKNVPPTL